MKTLKLLQRNLLYILLPTVLCVGCGKMNSRQQVYELDKNDTIFVRKNGHVLMAVIEMNDRDAEIIVLRRGSYMIADETYLFIKECWTYRQVCVCNGW